MFMDPEIWVAIAFIAFVALIVYLKVPGKVTGALGLALGRDRARA